jgi:hypothetical protein
VRAQHSATSARHPSIRRKKNGDSKSGDKSLITTSIVVDFQTALQELIETLLDTQSSIVVCMNTS